MADGKITGQELADGLSIANASLTGISTAPTAAAITNSTQIATTAFVNNATRNHGHGNITNLGAIGTTANLIVKTNTNGVLTTLAAGTTGQYLRGDGTWNAIDLSPYAPIANPTFTGNVSGITASMVGLGNVTNESKATMFTSPTFTGTVTIPTTNNFQFNSFGVGTAASGTAGEIRATNNVTAYYSDERLKDFHGTIQNALEKVLSLNGYYFTANEIAQSFGYDSKIMQVGVSAQEVEAVLPEVVTDAPIGHGYKTVWYEKIIPLLVEAIKEQQSQIQELKEMISNGT